MPGEFCCLLIHHLTNLFKMKLLRSYILFAAVGFSAVAFTSCKAKKLVQKPVVTDNTPPPVTKPTPPPPPPPPPAPPQPKPAAPAPPDYNFTNIQFDFNSSVLRTDAIQYLDHVVGEMKKDASAGFVLNGYASAEGTPHHNLILSRDRANSVKQYLTNAGIDPSRLATKGYGTKNPVASNDTEEGREKNRRVEVKRSH